MSNRRLIAHFCVVLFLLAGVHGLFASESTIIKNVSVFMPGGTWQADSFIIVKGCKIDRIGRMSEIKPNERGFVFDNEYDLKGYFVYPAFIDPYCRDLQVVEKPEKPDFNPANQMPRARRGRGMGSDVEPKTRKSFIDRNYFIRRQGVERLDLNDEKMKAIISNGYSILNIVPPDGIISGTTAVISLVSTKQEEAVLIPTGFLTLFLKPNENNEYPITPGGLLAELNQMKEDCFYLKDNKSLLDAQLDNRSHYAPDYDALYPYFKGEKQFMIVIANYPQQREAEILQSQLGITPIWVAHAELWRRNIDPSIKLILPLDFTALEESKYSEMGEKSKKEAEEKIYPEQLASFIKSHPSISLSAPGKGDYKGLYKNLRTLLKQGVTEAQLVNTLTVNPAKLLNISQMAGTIEKGKLAGLTIFDKKLEEPEAKIKMVFVEGKAFEFKEPEEKDKRREMRRGGVR